MFACSSNRTILLLAAVLAAGGCGRSSAPEVAPPTAIPILWLEPGTDADGVLVRVGHRLLKTPNEKQYEPVVSLTKDGKPVADAMVFVQLTPAKGGGESGEETACVFESADDERLTCYTPGALPVPVVGEGDSVAIRCRIIFAGAEGDWTKTVIPPK